MTDHWDLEPISGDPPVDPAPTGRRRAGMIAVVAVAAGAGGFGAGAATAADHPPRYDCGDRIVAVVAANGLSDEPDEVLVPLRPGDLGHPLPLLGSMATELVGSAVGHQQFRPAGGRLVLATELPSAAVGRTAQLVGTAGPPARVEVPITAPLCNAPPTAG